jgi:hypothetical protein
MCHLKGRFWMIKRIRIPLLFATLLGCAYAGWSQDPTAELATWAKVRYKSTPDVFEAFPLAKLKPVEEDQGSKDRRAGGTRELSVASTEKWELKVIESQTGTRNRYQNMMTIVLMDGGSNHVFETFLQARRWLERTFGSDSQTGVNEDGDKTAEICLQRYPKDVDEDRKCMSGYRITYFSDDRHFSLWIKRFN